MFLDVQIELQGSVITVSLSMFFIAASANFWKENAL